MTTATPPDRPTADWKPIAIAVGASLAAWLLSFCLWLGVDLAAKSLVEAPLQAPEVVHAKCRVLVTTKLPPVGAAPSPAAGLRLTNGLLMVGPGTQGRPLTPAYVRTAPPGTSWGDQADKLGSALLSDGADCDLIACGADPQPRSWNCRPPAGASVSEGLLSAGLAVRDPATVCSGAACEGLDEAQAEARQSRRGMWWDQSSYRAGGDLVALRLQRDVFGSIQAGQLQYRQAVAAAFVGLVQIAIGVAVAYWLLHRGDTQEMHAERSAANRRQALRTELIKELKLIGIEPELQKQRDMVTRLHDYAKAQDVFRWNKDWWEVDGYLDRLRNAKPAQFRADFESVLAYVTNIATP